MLWRRADVASVETPDRAAVLPLTGDLSNPPFVLQDQAAVVWHALQVDPRSETEIVRLVAGHYSIDPALIAADVTAFLQQLATQGLILAQ